VLDELFKEIGCFFFLIFEIELMTKELELKLVEKYPKILRDYGGDMKQTCMHWGIECDDGWYDLLDKCFEKLQYFCDLCSKDEKNVQVVANQIKEKYGTLRFYYSVEDADEIENDIISDIVFETEKKSEHTCEVTGKDGSSCVKRGWYKTLCYEEARKQGYVASDEELEEWWNRKDSKVEILSS
jgi:hypothetical protein